MSSGSQDTVLPLIDISSLFTNDVTHKAKVVNQIGDACRNVGFFYVTGHGIPVVLLEDLKQLAVEFMNKPMEEKLEISMSHSALPWVGYSAPKEELASGKADVKQALYFLTDRGSDDISWSSFRRNNLFPKSLPAMEAAIRKYMEACWNVANHIVKCIALSLGLEADYFLKNYTSAPILELGLLHYMSANDVADVEEGSWGAGEHTDYGFLTMLAQDEVEGLQIKTHLGWIDATPISGSLVCNIGDMLDRLTGGTYKSTPHRVRKSGQRERFSFPFFFSPGTKSVIKRLPNYANLGKEYGGWDEVNLQEELGETYGEYFLRKTQKAYPKLQPKFT